MLVAVVHPLPKGRTPATRVVLSPDPTQKDTTVEGKVQIVVWTV
jgi:hypothetical protein